MKKCTYLVVLALTILSFPAMADSTLSITDADAQTQCSLPETAACDNGCDAVVKSIISIDNEIPTIVVKVVGKNNVLCPVTEDMYMGNSELSVGMQVTYVTNRQTVQSFMLQAILDRGQKVSTGVKSDGFLKVASVDEVDEPACTAQAPCTGWVMEINDNLNVAVVEVMPNASQTRHFSVKISELPTESRTINAELDVVLDQEWNKILSIKPLATR